MKVYCPDRSIAAVGRTLRAFELQLTPGIISLTRRLNLPRSVGLRLKPNNFSHLHPQWGRVPVGDADMPTTLDTAVVRRSEPAFRNALAPAAVCLLVIAVVFSAMWELSRSDAAQSSFTPDWLLGTAVPP
jgi:hypothetical protein